ncbi:MAG: hypothetical protein AAB215_02415 [Planctomycetota bacterium]
MLVLTALALGQPDLSGTWDLALDVATLANVSFLGTTTIVSHQWMVAEVRREGDGYVVTHDTCGLTAETRPALAQTRFPQAFVDAIPDKTYPLELSTVEGRTRAYMDLRPLAIGFDPQQATVLPQAIDAPGVTDWDGDGKAAATIHLLVPIFGTIEVYQVQTATAVLDGWVRGNDEISGGAEIRDLQQRTLGASNRIFVQNPALRNDPAGSSFRMTRTTPGARCRSG